MVQSESAVAGFAERLGAALPRAISETFGGTAETRSLVPGDIAYAVAGLGG